MFSYKTGRIIGDIHCYHCVYLRGCDKHTKLFNGHNSWGPESSPIVRIKNGESFEIELYKVEVETIDLDQTDFVDKEEFQYSRKEW